MLPTCRGLQRRGFRMCCVVSFDSCPQVTQRASLPAASGSEEDATDVELSGGRVPSDGANAGREVLGKRRRAPQPQATGSTEDDGQCSSGGETGGVAGGRTRRSVRQRVVRTWDDEDGTCRGSGALPRESDEDASDEDGATQSQLVMNFSGLLPPAHILPVWAL
jgi:hypothetical protein